MPRNLQTSPNELGNCSSKYENSTERSNLNDSARITQGRSRARGTTLQAAEGGKSLPELDAKMNTLKLQTMAVRPNYGSKGSQIKLFTNWFNFIIGTKNPVVVFVYNVSISCQIETKIDSERRQFIFWKCVEQFSEHFPDFARMIYDDGKMLYSRDEIKCGPGIYGKNLDFRCRFPRDTRTMPCTIEITPVTANPLVLDVRRLALPQLSMRDTSAVQCLGLILTQAKRCPLLPSSQEWFGMNQRVFKIPKNINELCQGKEIWRGMFASISIGQNGMQIANFDVIHSVFYKDMNLAQFALEVVDRDFRDFRPFDPLEKLALEKALTGIKFQITHRGIQKRVYRSKGIGESANNLTFQKEEEDKTQRLISVAEYFSESYGITLQFSHFPTVITGKNGRSIFPLEVCKIDRPQRCPISTTQSERVRSLMIEKTRLDAPNRKRAIEQMLQESQLNANNDPFVRNFELDINPQMLKVIGRTLQPPNITTGNVTQNNLQQRKVFNGAWRMDDVSYSDPAKCTNFAFIIPASLRSKTKAFQDFCYNLTLACRQKRMLFNTNFGQDGSQPFSVQIYNNENDLYQAFQQCKKDTESHYNQNLELIFICVDGQNKAIYGRIKSIGDLELGIITQVVQWKTISKIINCARQPPQQQQQQQPQQQRTNSTLQQLILKINTKLGGVNFRTADGDGQIWQNLTTGEKPTLFLGIDVTHPGSFDDFKGQSVGAIVGNIDLECHKFDVSYRVQHRKQEQMIYFTNQIKERLMAFFEETNCRKPYRIIVFRDGISDSQFEAALNEEVTCIERACRSFDSYNPKITYVVVQKRHHTRFFPAETQRTGQGQNVPPGTTIDTRITHPVDFDYFLCSHLSPKGTARPAHYIVLHDESNFSADDLQAITYHLCYHNVRCTKSSSLPAPTFYAHLCCTRAQFYLQNKLASIDPGLSMSEEDLEKMLCVNENLREKMPWI